MGKTFSSACFPISSKNENFFVADNFVLDQFTIRELQKRIEKHELEKWTKELNYLNGILIKSAYSIEKILKTMNEMNIHTNDAMQYWLQEQFYLGHLNLARMVKVIDKIEKQNSLQIPCNFIEIHRNRLISFLERYIHVGEKIMQIGRKENERAEIGWLRYKILEIDRMYEQMREILVELRKTWSRPVVLEFRDYQKELNKINLFHKICFPWWDEILAISREKLDFRDVKWSDWSVDDLNMRIFMFYLQSTHYVMLNSFYIYEDAWKIVQPLNITLTYLDDMHKCYSYLIALFGQMEADLGQNGNLRPYEQYQQLDLMKNALKGCKKDLEFLQKMNEKFENFPLFLVKLCPQQILNVKLDKEYSQKTLELLEKHKALETIVNWRWKN